MPYKVKLVLPPNLNSTYLRSEFIEDGAPYTTTHADTDVTRDLNRHLLRFTFELVDNDTREPAHLYRVVSLALSNDPEFSTGGTVTLTNLPADLSWVPLSFLSPTLYRVTLDPNYFLDPASYPNPILSRGSSVDEPTGTFEILNWPLSADGGLSTVYMRAVVEAANPDGTPSGVESQYPEGYGVYDQIFWQSEPPSRPGAPQPQTPELNWTGRKISWRFRASEEGSSGLFRSGVARYQGDILEVRGDVLTTLAPTPGGGARRTLARESFVPITAMSVSNFNMASLHSFSAGSNTIESAATIGDTTGTLFKSGSAITTSFGSPDVAVQANYTINSVATINDRLHIQIKAYRTGHDEPGHAGDEDEVVVEVVVRNDAPPQATLYRYIAGNVWPAPSFTAIYQTTTLPDYATELFFAGGTLEMFLSPHMNPGGDNRMLAEAYFTPDISGAPDPDHSFLLASAVVPTFTAGGPDFVIGGEVAAYTSNSGSVNITIHEVALAGGRFALDADLGDCKEDDAVSFSFPTTYTQERDWVSAIGDTAAWQAIKEPKTGPSYTPASGSVALAAPVVTTSGRSQRSTMELEVALPTMSDRARVTWLMTHDTGEFYVGFSPRPMFVDPTDTLPETADMPRPMGARCDPDSEPVDEPMLKPTILVAFSNTEQVIRVLERRADNTLTAKIVAPYTPSLTTEEWDIQINTLSPSGVADGSWIMIHRAGALVVYERMEQAVPADTQGLGYFVAVGVRSDRNTNGDTAQVGAATLYHVIVHGLPPSVPLQSGDAVSVRHFLKGGTGAVYGKPLLGQQVVSMLSDLGEYRNMNDPDLRLANVQVATTGIVVQSGLIVVDGWQLGDGDRILVKDQTDQIFGWTNGIWRANVGPWTRVTDFTDGSQVKFGQWVYVENGTANAGTTWTLTTPEPEDGYDMTTASPFAKFSTGTRVYVQPFNLPTVGTFFTTVHPLLLEIKARSIASDTPPHSMRVRFFADGGDGAPDYDTPLTNWIDPVNIAAEPPQRITGLLSPYNDLIQFQLTGYGLLITAGSQVWLAVEASGAYEIGLANSLAPGVLTEIFTYSSGTLDLPGVLRDDADDPIPYTGWIATTSLWHKLFSDFKAQSDNSQHRALLAARVRADSHARICSQASAISTTVQVDILPPQDIVHSSVGRPTLLPLLPPGVRTVTVQITADDTSDLDLDTVYEHDSGLLAFRVARELDYGAVSFTAWQPWSAFLVGGGVEYVTYLYGTWPYREDGSAQTTLLEQNMGTDGPRRVWAQVMDRVGNFSETFPITVLAQNIAIVDTVPPTGTAAFVSGEDGSALTLTNERSAWLKIASQDRITAVKDFRLRTVGNTFPATWVASDQYRPYSLIGADGLKRVEAQFRDYGNNILQEAALWDRLEHDSEKGVIFIKMARWKAPGAAAESLYLSAIRSQAFTGLTLDDSGDPNYVAGTAFIAVSTTSGSVGRRILLRTTDRVTVIVNSVLWTRWYPTSTSSPCSGAPSNSYRIDNERGLVVFCTTPASGATLAASIKRESAVIYRWDGSAVLKVADLGNLGERAVLSLAGTADYLYLGGGSGHIWKYDGRVVTGPAFTATSGSTLLPVNLLWLHQFPHESEPYLYVGTGAQPRLFRAASSLASVAGAWNRVAVSGFLNLSSGDVTCAASAYDTLFIGTVQGEVLRYTRTLQYTDDMTETETLTASALLNAHAGDEEESDILPVAALLATGEQVLAAIGDRPEVFNYVVHLTDLPARPEEWSSQVFDRMFRNNPEPWQFYHYNGLTNVRQFPDTLAGLTAFRISDGHHASGYRDGITLHGVANQTVSFTLGEGSDWEQAIFLHTSWTFETEMMYLPATGGGRQGIEISDGRYRLNVSVSPTTVRIQSGASVAEVPFKTNTVTPFGAASLDLEGDLVYPERGVKKIWNFYDTTSITHQEDHGPYWAGEPTGDAGTILEWAADAFITSMAAGTPESENTTSFATTTRFLRIVPTTEGAPRIKWTSSAGLSVDTQTKLFVRMRVAPVTADNLRHARLRFSWTEGTDAHVVTARWEEMPLHETEDFVTYVLHPSWGGTVRSLLIEVAGLFGDTENVVSAFSGTNPATIDIDYIALASDSSATLITDNLTPIRIGVNDKDVKVWMGRHEQPLINVTDFLRLPTTEVRLRLGKTDQDEPDSIWAWGGIRFVPDAVVAPVLREEHDFALFWRFQSTGGARCLVNHLGTAWALTDGLSTMKISDDPDERAIKTFSYFTESQTWEQEDPPYLRLASGKGVIRPLDAAAFNGTLVIAGQQGEIAYIAPTGPTRTPGAGGLTLTGQTPRLTRRLTPHTGSLTLSGVTPTRTP